MFISDAQDLMYFVGSLAIIWVSGFLCWALYEVGRFFKQSNEIVEDTRETSGQLNDLIRDIVEKVSGLVHIADLVTGLGKQFAHYLPGGDEEGEGRTKRRKK